MRRRSPKISPPVSCGRECKRGEAKGEERRREEGEESFKMSGCWSSSRGQDTPPAFMHTACTSLQCKHACVVAEWVVGSTRVIEAAAICEGGADAQ